LFPHTEIMMRLDHRLPRCIFVNERLSRNIILA
jgi:hypothetical protein